MRAGIFLLSLTIFIACSSPRYTLDTSKITFNDILDSIVREQDQIKSLEATSRISVDSPEFSGTFFAEVIYLEQDSLLISVSGPFGIQAGTLFIGKERFIFYNQIANKFYNGSVYEFKDKKFFQFPLSLSELMKILVAKETLTSMKIHDFTIKDKMFYILAEKGDSEYQMWIDYKTGRIKKITSLVGGQIHFIREYDDFIKVMGINFPRKIIMTRPKEKQAVSLYYTNIVLNKDIDKEKFVINVSDRAEQMDFFLNNETRY